jgi:hypothetical protein
MNSSPRCSGKLFQCQVKHSDCNLDSEDGML